VKTQQTRRLGVCFSYRMPRRVIVLDFIVVAVGKSPEIQLPV
jgi:hypothetical protein